MTGLAFYLKQAWCPVEKQSTDGWTLTGRSHDTLENRARVLGEWRTARVGQSHPGPVLSSLRSEAEESPLEAHLPVQGEDLGVQWLGVG